MSTYKVVYNCDFGGFEVPAGVMEQLVAGGVVPEGTSRFPPEYELARHHPELVRLVEAMGPEQMGRHDLAIAEITSPLYYIEEYDGMETVHTVDNMKWVDAREVAK